MLRIIGLIIGAAVICAMALPVKAGAAETVNLSILYTADTHGHLHSFYYDSRKPVGGIAKRAIFFQDKRRHKSMIWLTLDTGDALSGTALADVFQGYVPVQAMNKLAYDAMSLGVHDFDFGTDVLKQRIAEAEFSVVCANVQNAATGEPFTTPYIILERKGVRIAIMGLITGELASHVAPQNFSGLTVIDPVQTARQLVPQLEGQADIIIALTHLGINEDIRLASEVRGIDVVIGGMSHSELQVPMKFEETLIVHNPEFGRSVGMLKLSYDPEQNHRRVYFYNELVPMAGQWVENNNYLEWLAGYSGELNQRMEILTGSAGLELSNLKVRSAETPLGNYVTDILRTQTGADVALLPAAFFAGTLPQGPITLGDLYTALPYDQYAEVLEVSGGELKEILDDATSQIGKAGFPQVSGLSFGILGGKAYQIQVGGRELDPFATYRLVTSDALADGRYGYSQIGTVQRRNHTGRLIRDIIRQQLKTGQAAQASVGGRITFHAYDPIVEQQPATAPVAATPVSTPPEIAPEETVIVPPATGIQPAGTPPGGDSVPPASTQPGTTPGATPGGNTEAGLDGLRYDRNGELITQPVVVEDEVITDTSSDIESQGGSTSPGGAPYSAPTTPPATTPTTPPADVVNVPLLGSTHATYGGLDYQYSLTPSADGIELKLRITNVTQMPIEMNYSTSEQIDFLVKNANNLVWNYHYNWFFMQAQQTETLAPGDSLDFSKVWDAISNDGSQIPGGALRFEAVHHLRENPVRLELDAVLP